MKLNTMPEHQKGGFKPGTTYWSSLDAKTFFSTCYYVGSLLGTTAEPNVDKFKIRVAKTLDEGKVELDIRCYEDADDFRIAEFIKVDGPLMEYYEFVNKLKEELEALEGKEGAENVEITEQK